MTDVRALLAAERQSRRITHPHLSYTKSGMLICTICNLNVKSEALWEGHLRSANHRKNVQSTQENTAGKGQKRKIEDVDEPLEERYEADTDRRKKPKSQSEIMAAEERVGRSEVAPVSELEELEESSSPSEEENPIATSTPVADPSDGPARITSANGSNPIPAVDEDEWAAFEREVAPLTATRPAYSATISAAPVSATQIEEQAEEDKRRRLETEAEDEKEEGERRLEEEFDVMEEMEERVRKLREKRAALKSAVKVGDDTGQGKSMAEDDSNEKEEAQDVKDESDEHDDDDDDEDDWYS